MNLHQRFLSICHSRAVRTLVPPVAGFLGYGSWGVLCNLAHGWEMGLRAGLVQGSLSFTITLVFNEGMEFIYKRLKNKLASILITCTGFISVSYMVNTLAGTPEVLATIAPGAVIGSVYVISYINGLAAIASRSCEERTSSSGRLSD